MDALERIDRNMANLTRAQKQVADYIHQNTVQAAFSTIDNLSKTIGTSTTTIVRFSWALGFAGYSELQSSLQDIIMSRETPSAKLSRLHHRDKEDSLIADVINKHTESIDETLFNLSHERMYAACKMIADAKHIYVTGGRGSHSVAFFLMHNLDRLSGRCDMIGGEDYGLPEKISRIGAGDVLLVVNMPRYLSRTLAIAKLARKQGARVISITDSLSSPYCPISDVFFLANYKGLSFFNSAVSSMVIADIILSVVSDMMAESSRDFMDTAEAVSQQLAWRPKQ